MEFVILDYSPIYYKTIKKTPVPYQRKGKFVQIRDKDTEYLVFSPQGFSSYHADIVERFCDSMKIQGVYNKEHYSYKIHTPGWIVVGGGKWIVNQKDKTLYLFDDSGAYGKFDTSGLGERIKNNSSSFYDYSVLID